MLDVVFYVFAAIGVIVTLAAIYMYATTPSESELMRRDDEEPEPFDLEDKKHSCRPSNARPS